MQNQCKPSVRQCKPGVAASLKSHILAAAEYVIGEGGQPLKREKIKDWEPLVPTQGPLGQDAPFTPSRTKNFSLETPCAAEPGLELPGLLRVQGKSLDAWAGSLGSSQPRRGVTG